MNEVVLVTEHTSERLTAGRARVSWTIAVVISLAIHCTVILLFANRPLAEDAGKRQSIALLEVSLSLESPVATEQQAAPAPQASTPQSETSPDKRVEKEDPRKEQGDSTEDDQRDAKLAPTSSPAEAKVEHVPDAPAELPPRASTKKGGSAKAAEKRKQIDPRKRDPRPDNSAPTERERPANRMAAPRTGAAQAQAAASWSNAVAAHLNRYKRYPDEATGSGTAVIRIAINQSGGVVSASLNQSSGNRAFDAEAISLARRASPVPPPPEGRGTATVPIHFKPVR